MTALAEPSEVRKLVSKTNALLEIMGCLIRKLSRIASNVSSIHCGGAGMSFIPAKSDIALRNEPMSMLVNSCVADCFIAGSSVS
jgi:hypothetical protein